MLWLLFLLNPAIVVLWMRAATGWCLLAGAISCGCCLGLLVAYASVCYFCLRISLKLHSMYDYVFRLSYLLWRSPRRAVLCVVFMLYYCLLCVMDGSLAAWRYRYLAVSMPGLVRRSLQGLAWTTSLCVMHRVDTPLKVVLLYRSIAGFWYPAESCGTLCFAFLLFLFKDIHLGDACVPLSLCFLLRLACGHFPWWVIRCLGLCEIFMPTFGKRGVLCDIVEAFFAFIDFFFDLVLFRRNRCKPTQ